MFDPSRFDPSKMDPKLIAEMAQLFRELPPEKLQRMQTLVHNAMAGFDVKAEMEEFERSLPAEFRERLARLAYAAAAATPATPSSVAATPDAVMTDRDARLTVLRAVAEGRLSAEEADKILFP